MYWGIHSDSYRKVAVMFFRHIIFCNIFVVCIAILDYIVIRTFIAVYPNHVCECAVSRRCFMVIIIYIFLPIVYDILIF